MLIKILTVNFILFVNLNNFVLSQSKLNCYYSKYMLYYFNTKEIYFKKIASQNPIPVGKIEEFENEIKSMGEVVLTLLENLYYNYENETAVSSTKDNINPYTYAHGLLTLNLYLNNVSKTLRLHTYSNLTNAEKKLKGYNIFIIEFQKIYQNIIDCLRRSISNDCFNGAMNYYYTQDFCYDNKYDNKHIKYYYFIKLLPVLSNYNEKQIINNKLEKMQTLIKLDEVEVDFKLTIMKKPKRNMHTVVKIQNRFHPNNILLLNLFRDKRNLKENELLSNSSNPMDLLRNVPINVKLENGKSANVTTLFEMIQRDFDVDCVYSYQKQILAATIHPVYSLIGTLVILMKKIYFSKAEGYSEIEKRSKVFRQQLIGVNDVIKKSIENLVSFKIFPENIQCHLEATLLHFIKISNCIYLDNIENLKLKWIDQLYRRCTKAMTINLLIFDETVKNINVYNKDECNEVIIRLENKVKEVQSYIQCLSYYKEDYRNIFDPITLLSRSYVLTDDLDCNIIKKNKSGYHLMKNN
ncbi:uncharacterized protein LOC126904603 [Daktulosphaira vitifoliae]|uniref:uncharacterized protein LOC126904603 n=1 Tax=Daktulosphaira vitifoliae TaxID=58002 RepID=UPI0021A98624|nr:uncharacterized protein LOC126904603 [Daktulosphaira vitifoliae]